ncbi:MAG: VOC family protein [Pseudomonadota bacterium]
MANEACELSPYLTVKNADAMIAFYEQAFGAELHYALRGPNDGKIGHAELSIFGRRMMLADEFPDFGALGPETIGGSPVKLHLMVDDVDKVFAAALAAGATELRPVKDQFHGHRGGMIADPAGHHWFIQTKTEDVSPEEMQRRWASEMG